MENKVKKETKNKNESTEKKKQLEKNQVHIHLEHNFAFTSETIVPEYIL